MSILGSIGDAIGSSFGNSSWTDIIGTGLKVGGSLLGSYSQKQATNSQYQSQILQSQSQLIQSSAQLRAAAAQEQEGVYKQIEYNRLADEARENAARATVNAATKAYLLRRQGQETAENAVAGYAASGVTAGSGTAGYIPSYITGRAMEDAFSAFQEGKDSAEQYTKQADAYITAGNQARSASDTAAAGIRSEADALASLAGMTKNIAGSNRNASNTGNLATLLGNIGSIASQWLK